MWKVFYIQRNLRDFLLLAFGEYINEVNYRFSIDEGRHCCVVALSVIQRLTLPSILTVVALNIQPKKFRLALDFLSKNSRKEKHSKILIMCRKVIAFGGMLSWNIV